MNEAPASAPSSTTPARIALGCGNFGGIGSAPDFFGRGLTEDDAFALMDAAFQAGIDWFDTADAYGGGRSERAIGRWMAARGVRPGEWGLSYGVQKTLHPCGPRARARFLPGS